VNGAVERGDPHPWIVVVTGCVVEVDCAVITGSVVVGTDVVTASDDDGELEVGDDLLPLLLHAANRSTAKTAQPA
jgi:hypothetical protein